ncbi:MAG: pyridoxal phosphate-dependent aminotransferase [Limnobacter sp.]|uniref:pyridoxal phosphate-dependent aminotransferase n=1 Tax=Limnobacter sp. TaxID=2003368 RepID=UPI00391A05CF
MLSKRALTIKPSPTLAVTAKAAQLKAEGKDIIGLGVGEPDFDTPQHIKDAAKKAIDAGFTKYTNVGGTPGLKNAVITKLKRDNGLDYKPNEVVVGVGGKQCIFNLALATIDEGDEVIIPAPFWVSYADIIEIAGGTPVIVFAGIEQGFKITPAQLEAAITPATKMFMINSPSNPTGAVYTLEELKALGEVLLKHPKILVATDDMYEHINLNDSKFVNILNACPELKDRTIVLNGVSKAYSMTGWRIGFAAGPAKLIDTMTNLQSQSTSNPTSISQVAAEVALTGDQECLKPMVKAFRERNEFVYNALNACPTISSLKAEGAFYAFVDARKAITKLAAEGKIKAANDIELTAYLLDAGVAVVPGSAFGAEGYFRISIATSMENLEKACDRITKALG